MNLVISGSVELAAFFVCALLMSRIGRRQLLVFSHFLSAFALLGTLAAEPRAEDGVSVNPVVMGNSISIGRDGIHMTVQGGRIRGTLGTLCHGTKAQKSDSRI